MANDHIVDLLSTLAFFSEFTPEEKKEIASLETSVVQFQTGDHVIRQGETDRFVYLIVKGWAVTTRNEAPTYELSRFNPGDIFGEMSSLTNRPRSTNVRVRSDYLIALKMDSDLFKKPHPPTLVKLKDQLLSTLTHRLEMMNNQICELKKALDAAQDSQKKTNAELEVLRSRSGTAD